MRAFVRRAVTTGIVAGAALVYSACDAKKQTEYVGGISTQVQVPRDMRGIRVSISVGGFQTFCRGYRAYNGIVQLPRSLGAYAQNDPNLSGPVTYTIVGYGDDIPEDEEFDDIACREAAVGKDNVRIMRRSRQPYIPEKILFLPLALKYSCFDKTDCNDADKTCKGGRCVPADTNPDTLPEYSPDLVDGTGGACFSIKECLGAAKPAVVVDPNKCIYAIPNTPSEPPLADGGVDFLPGGSLGEGINVAIVYDGGLNQEVLDKDGEEGFTIPDPAKPQQFQLAPGLCDLVKGVDEQGKETVHRITAVRGSEICRAKNKFQPICAGDALAAMGLEPNGSTGKVAPPQCSSIELKPPEAALMFVVDNTVGHSTFFESAETQGLKLSLDDPAFSRTKIGLVYAPSNLSCGAGPAEIPLENASTVREKILGSFGDYAPPTPTKTLEPGPTAFEGGLSRAYAAIGAQDAFRRAVLVLGNRDFNPPDPQDQCPGLIGGPAALAQSAKAGASNIDTYVILLSQTPGGDAPAATALQQGDQLAAAGGTVNATNAQGSSNKIKAKERFQTIVESLATCVYDVDVPAAPANSTLSYTNPLTSQTVAIPAGNCTAEGAPGVGWGYAATDPKPNKKRVYLCNDSCKSYRDVLKTAASFNLTFGQPAPAIPIFQHKPDCAPK